MTLNQLPVTSLTKPLRRDEYDYIVIGGGTAGSVIAHRLAESGNTSILVIEAGRHDFDHSIRIPVASISLLDPDKNLVWNYKTVPQEGSAQGFLNNRMTLPLGKVLGGSSSIGESSISPSTLLLL